MAYKVIFAPAAIARLEDIVRYIAVDDPTIAEAFALHLISRAELLADFPELDCVSETQERSAPSLRSLLHLLSSEIKEACRRDNGILACRTP